MKILIINIDSEKCPNIALKKIEKFHLDNGDDVVWDMPLMKYGSDKIYVSCIFDWNRWKCDEWEGIAEIGGSGYDIEKKLPEEIDSIKPKINVGFTTRGCIRKCYFCIVNRKEGGINIVGDIYDFWDGKSKLISIMDNNILAARDHFFKIADQIKSENLVVDFCQGLDHRLLDKEIATTLLELRHKYEIRFAYDDINQKEIVLKSLSLLKDCGCGDYKTRWYIYVGENDTFDTVYQRMCLLRDHKQTVYVMRDRKVINNPWYVLLSAWGNHMGAFKVGTLLDVCQKSEKMRSMMRKFKISENDVYRHCEGL